MPAILEQCWADRVTAAPTGGARWLVRAWSVGREYFDSEAGEGTLASKGKLFCGTMT